MVSALAPPSSSSLVTVVALLALFGPSIFLTVTAYRPVVIVHGVFDEVKDFDNLVSNITASHPGTQVTVPNLWVGALSAEGLWNQMPLWQETLLNASSSAKDGINLICMSQGNMICRAFLELEANHNVHNYVSLAGPHLGQYGATSKLSPPLPPVTRELAYLLFYTKEGQEDISIANYWHDPRFVQKYLVDNIWLPHFNVLNGSNITPTEAALYKENFLKITSLVLVGGPDDGIVTPWQSSHMGFYSDPQATTVAPLQDQEVYLNDTFGVRTLNESSRLFIYTFEGVTHLNWKNNHTVFVEAILPYLD